MGIVRDLRSGALDIWIDDLVSKGCTLRSEAIAQGYTQSQADRIVAYAKLRGQKTCVTSRDWNETFFDEYNPLVAYIVGLLAADGHVVTNYRETQKSPMIYLKLKDLTLLESVRNALACDKKIRKVKGQDAYVLTLISADAVDRLKSLGFIHNKSTNEYEITVPDCYLSHYVRGFSDGDGNLSFLETSNGRIFSWQIAAHIVNEPYLRLLKSQIETATNAKLYVYQDKNMARLKTTGLNAMRVLNWLYTSKTLHLDRKLQTYRNYLESFQKKPTKLRMQTEFNQLALKAMEVCDS